MLREVRVPDMAPAERPIRPGCLSMCAGDFVEVYSKPDQVILKLTLRVPYPHPTTPPRGLLSGQGYFLRRVL